MKYEVKANICLEVEAEDESEACEAAMDQLSDYCADHNFRHLMEVKKISD